MLTTVLFVPDVRVCERGDDILSRKRYDLDGIPVVSQIIVCTDDGEWRYRGNGD